MDVILVSEVDIAEQGDTQFQPKTFQSSMAGNQNDMAVSKSLQLDFDQSKAPKRNPPEKPIRNSTLQLSPKLDSKGVPEKLSPSGDSNRDDSDREISDTIKLRRSPTVTSRQKSPSRSRVSTFLGHRRNRSDTKNIQLDTEDKRNNDIKDSEKKENDPHHNITFSVSQHKQKFENQKPPKNKPIQKKVVQTQSSKGIPVNSKKFLNPRDANAYKRKSEGSINKVPYNLVLEEIKMRQSNLEQKQNKRPRSKSNGGFTLDIDDEHMGSITEPCRNESPELYQRRKDCTLSMYMENEVMENKPLPDDDSCHESSSDSEDGKKWLATHNEDGKIYFYDESSSRSQWTLPEVVDDINSNVTVHPEKTDQKRISIVQENLPELLKSVKKEGFLSRTTFIRDGRKVRKDWKHSWVRYIQGSFSTGSSGLLLFTKNADAGEKKIDVFDLYPPCELEINTKKTSRSIAFAIRNGQNSEVLLQAEVAEIRDEWVKIIQAHEGMKVVKIPEKEDKRNTRREVRRAASVETLNDDTRGIRDRLIQFIRRRPDQDTLVKAGIFKDQVFGSTLAILHQLDKTLVPLFVLQCIKSIEKKEENLKTDGLYRISGNAAIIQKIRYEVARTNYQILDEEKDVHNLSGALKLFFRELKEPVIPFANYQSFIQATGSEFRRTDRQADMLMKAVLALPKENYETLKVLLQHLLRVSEFESENRMSLMNLAIVFGPCLLWPESANACDLMTDVMLHNRVIEGLLTDNAKIFK